MNRLLSLFLFLTISSALRGQAGQEELLRSVLKDALGQGKLPSIILNSGDPIISVTTGKQYLAVQITNENGLEVSQEVSLDTIKVHVFSNEQIFLFSPRYCIRPLKIKNSQSKFMMQYITVRRQPRKGEEEVNCHSGTIKGVRKGDKWIVDSSSVKTIECEDALNWSKN